MPSLLYRSTPSRSSLGKQRRRRRLSPVFLVLAVVAQPLLLWAWYRHDAHLQHAVTQLHHKRGAAGGPTAASPDVFWPSSSPLPVHHSPALLDYSNHPVAPSRPSARQFLFSPDLYAQVLPVVAVVTTTRDAHPDWLRETAASVFGQSLQSLVWIIVDDATTSAEALVVLADLEKDARVVVLRNEGGLGVGRSRNRALEYLGEMDEGKRPRYVVSLEDDDLFELTALEKVVFMLESNGLWDLGGFQVVRFGEENSLGYGGLHTGAKHLVMHNHVPDAAVVTTRALLQSGCRYEEDDEFLGAENWMLWLCLAKEGYWGGTVPEALFWHRIKPAESKRRSILALGKAPSSLHIKDKFSALVTSGAFPEIAPRPAEQLENVRWNFPLVNALAPPPDGKTLLLVLSTFAPTQAGLAALHQLELLAADGYRVTVVATHFRPQDGLALRPDLLKWTHDVHVLPSYVRPSDAPGYLKNLVLSRGVHDVVFAESELLYELLPALSEHLPDVRFVDYLHVDGSSESFVLSTISERFTARTLVSSSNVAAQLVAAGHSALSVGVLPSGIDTQAFFPVSRKVRAYAKRKLLGVTDKTTVILVSSPLAEVHRPHFMPAVVAALEAQGHSRFLVVFITTDTGGGDGVVSLDTINREIAARDLTRRVRVFAGGLDHPESYLAASDVYLRLSTSNETSSTLGEAMAMGLGVVSTRTSGVADLLAHDVGILVDAPSSDSPADAAAKFANALGVAIAVGPGARRERAARTRAVAQDKLDWRILQTGLLDELRVAKLAQDKKHVHEGSWRQPAQLPVNPAAHYALQAVLMENHDETDFAVSQNKLRAPPRHGVGKELQDRCGETSPDMSSWINSLERAENCRPEAKFHPRKLQRSALFQCSAWCIWDLTTESGAGWMYDGTCFTRFADPDKTWCRDWTHTRPKVTLSDKEE
ncbi:glycosyltransferase family 4 protein [Rhodotorula graminis WP1]|uniref:Glycosyltransferase family 4 protein n=1 Tax=Rhodotorula graminis (strain WP1) TaxID=578459 RepID=A0A0P9H0K7_RHOGW|nr:glycosyltransferase family 4 protein [Rhodotorula graminis WP1]KPV73370.1 glycosyltransferase family 4 protein [Rhodotorula graminis WP1]